MTVETRTVNGVVLTRSGPEDFWRDDHGTVFALEEAGSSVDDTVRLGVGMLSLPKDDPLNDAARAHDYCYSSPACQASYSREEIDALLEKQLELLAGKRTVKTRVLATLARWFGGAFWENNRTR